MFGGTEMEPFQRASGIPGRMSSRLDWYPVPETSPVAPECDATYAWEKQPLKTAIKNKKEKGKK